MNAHSAVWKRLAHVFIGGILALTVLSPLAAPALASPAQLAAAAPRLTIDFLVNRSDDADIETCAGSNTGNDCTLRGAIKKINTGNIVDSTIGFAPAVTLTALLNPLPAVVVTGTWILGNSGLPRIDAVLMSNGNVFSVSASTSQIANLSIVNGPGFGDGIFADIWVAGGQGVDIASNFLGTLPVSQQGSDCHPNPDGGSLVSRNSGYGVFVDSTVVGSTGAANGSVYIHGNTIGCHDGHGIVLNGADYVHVGEDSSGNADGNLIGENSNLTGLPNGAVGVGDGIDIVAAGGSDGARFNIIRNNSIVDNGRYGVLLSGNGLNNSSSTYLNVIAGNHIGIDALGAFGNQGDGVFIGNGAFFNLIGGISAADRNVISANHGSGVHISNSSGNVVYGNYIGTGLTGAGLATNAGAGQGGPARDGGNSPSFSPPPEPGNRQQGVFLDNADSNQIGGSLAADQNVISGNLGAGIKMLASSNNTVGYNLIGINAAGTAALPNAQDGVWLTSGSTNNTIGSSTFGEGQYIGGNGGAGVQITTSDSNNVRVSTRIGVGPTGALLGNGGGGVFLTNSANNFVAPTLVAHNSGAGVAAIGLTSVNNFLSPFNVFDNTGLPVDLGNNGATANDPGDSDPGPNNLLNYPVITAASGSVVTGTVCANCAVYIYAASGNPAAAGGGGSYLAATNAIGVNWSTTLPGGRTKFDVTLQAYDGLNTSEFSPRPILFLPITRR